MTEPPVLHSRLTLQAGSSSSVCELKRHLAPRTVGIMLRSLPLEGNAHRLGAAIIYFETRVDSGMERARTSFRRGDVAFLPSSGSVCFFARDATSRAMTPVGRLLDPGALDAVGRGDVLRLYAA